MLHLDHKQRLFKFHSIVVADKRTLTATKSAGLLNGVLYGRENLLLSSRQFCRHCALHYCALYAHVQSRDSADDILSVGLSKPLKQ